MTRRKVDISKYSQRERADVPEDLTWDVKSVYLNMTAWEKDKKQSVESFEKILEKKNSWTKTAKRMFEMLEIITATRQKLTKLYIYVQLHYDVEMANNKYTEMEGEIKSLFVEFQSIVSFVESEIAAMNKTIINQFYIKESKLKIYKRKKCNWGQV